MRKIYSILALMLCCLSLSAAVGDTFEQDGYTFKVDAEGEVGITTFRVPLAPADVLTIPDQVTNEGVTYDVVRIGQMAFYAQNASLLSNTIVIGNNVRTIDNSAFLMAEADSINIPVSVTSIGTYAFGFCPNLAQVDVYWTDLSDVWVEKTAFGGSNAKSPVLYVERGTVGEYDGDAWDVFSSKLERGVVIEQFVVDGLKYQVMSSDAVKLLGPSGASYSGALTIPASVQSEGDTYRVVEVADNAFYQKGITSLAVLGSNLTTIGAKAFSFCQSLSTVTLPISLTDIESQAFALNPSLSLIRVWWEYLSGVTAAADIFMATAATLYVPLNMVSIYEAKSPWNGLTITDRNLFRKNGDWHTASNWILGIVPAAGDNVRVSAQATITSTRTVNEIEIVENGKIIVSPGAKLNATGMIKNTAPSKLVLQSSMNQASGTVSFSGTGDAPYGTVTLQAPGYKSGDLRRWSYMGTPLCVNGAVVNVFKGAWMCEWRENTSNASLGENWHFLINNDQLVPFTGYALTQESAKSYTFSGQLNGGDRTLSLAYNTGTDNSGFNLMANSYSSALDISRMDVSDFTNADATIYMFDTATGRYVTVPIDLPNSAGKVIPPMQGFFVRATAKNAKLNLAYNRMVALNSDANQAQFVRRVRTDDVRELCMSVEGSEGCDEVRVVQSDAFTSGFDNGYDGVKFMGVDQAPQLYSVSDEHNRAVNAVPELDDLYLGFRPGVGADYVMQFDAVPVDEMLYLHDLVAHETVAIIEGDEYEFTAEEGTETTRRFKVTRSSDYVVEQLSELYVTYSSIDERLRIESYVDELMEARVCDMAGRQVCGAEALHIGVNYLQVNGLRPGVYMVYAKGAKSSVARKFMVE